MSELLVTVEFTETYYQSGPIDDDGTRIGWVFRKGDRAFCDAQDAERLERAGVAKVVSE
jgi:hypothetical protein